MKRQYIKEKKRVVIKIGTSTITHEETGALDLVKLEKLVRLLTDLKNQGKEVVLVSSGAISVGRKAMGIKMRPKEKIHPSGLRCHRTVKTDYGISENCLESIIRLLLRS